jgi:hypothetical protein
VRNGCTSLASHTTSHGRRWKYSWLLHCCRTWNYAHIIPKSSWTLLSVFLNEITVYSINSKTYDMRRVSCDSVCVRICLPAGCDVMQFSRQVPATWRQDVMSCSAVDRYQLPDVISQPTVIFMVYDSQRICLNVILILENSSSVILRKKCLCCFRF